MKRAILPKSINKNSPIGISYVSSRIKGQDKIIMNKSILMFDIRW